MITIFQLKIEDVHIRYEDSTTIPNESFAFGITIKSLSAQSTDENWVRNYVHCIASHIKVTRYFTKYVV